MDFGHAMIDGQKSGVTHIPCWLITDHRSWNRYVVAGHLPIPKIPGAPVPTGRKVPQAWLESGVVKAAMNWDEMAAKIGVPAHQLSETAGRFNELAQQGPRRRFQPRRQRLRQLLRRSDPAQPQPVSAGRPAVLRVPHRPRRSRDLGWPAYRRIRPSAAARRHRGARTVRGGQHRRAGHGPQLRRRRGDHRPGHDLRLCRSETRCGPDRQADPVVLIGGSK